MRFIPTRAALNTMAILALSWPDVMSDMEHVETVTPVVGSETRERWCGDTVQAFVEPGTYDGEPALYIVGITSRKRAEGPVEPVVGVETPYFGPRARGAGAGSSWPRSWRCLLDRIREVRPEAVIRTGGKHLMVLIDGKRVATLPVTASDHRALVNSCIQLRKVGIDVRRSA